MTLYMKYALNAGLILLGGIIGISATFLMKFEGLSALQWTDLHLQISKLKPAQTQEFLSTCTFDLAAFPADTQAYAVVTDKARPLSFQIDKSGLVASQVDLIINKTEHPVVLLLIGDTPTVWNLSWTLGTRIVGVIATGVYTQAVAGLPFNTPVIRNSVLSVEHTGGRCMYDFAESNDMRDSSGGIKAATQKIFGRNLEAILPIDFTGKGLIGSPFSESTPIITSGDITVQSFYDPEKPLYGEYGNNAALAKGLIRRATQKDINDWRDAVINSIREKSPSSTAEKEDGSSDRRLEHLILTNDTYVVQGRFAVPEGNYLGTYFIPKGIPFPDNYLQKSSMYSRPDIYDFNTLQCFGPECG